MKNFTLKKYDTLEQLIVWLFGLEEGLSESDEVGAFDADKNEIVLSHDEFMSSLNDLGYWGAIDDENVIHYWIDGTREFDLSDLIHFFGHELGHNTGKPLEDEVDEEMRAEEYGELASLAYKFASEIYKKSL